MNDPFIKVLDRVEHISPFHARAASKMDLRVTPFFFDGKVEGYARVWYDPSVDKFAIDFTPRLLAMTIDTQAFVLMHEVEHVLRSHLSKPKLATARRWNIAGDCCINNDLIDEMFSKMVLDANLIADIVTKERMQIPLETETIDEVYKLLPEDLDDIATGTLASDDIATDNQGTEAGDDNEEAVKDLIRELHKEEGKGGLGNVPTRFKDLLSKEHERKLDWKALLWEAFGRVKPLPKPAFSKINLRKWAANGIIAPGTRLPREARVFVGCDTSGSVVGALPWFLKELQNCVDDLAMPIDLCFTETGPKEGWLTGIEKIEGDPRVKKAIDNYYGGAAHFDWVYPKLYEEDPKYDLVILFTDCYNTPPMKPPHGPGGRTVILNIGSPDTKWQHCEVYYVKVNQDEL